MQNYFIKFYLYTVLDYVLLFDSGKMKFAVVEFDDGGSSSVEIVSETWLAEDNNMCYWPPCNGLNHLRSFVLRHRPPQENWELHAVRKLATCGK